jgi:hypothetical protein
MSKEITLKKVLEFFLTKIIVGIVIIGGLVAFTEWSGRLLLEKTGISGELVNVLIAISDAAIALFAYILLFRYYENRIINELSFSSFGKNALRGFATGFVLQSLFISVIYLTGNYSITYINPASFLLPPFTTAITAGFVSEILIRGIAFRLIEEKSGTVIAIIIFTLLFAIFHLNVEGATPLSVVSTAIQAGLLLSAAYVFTRSLWFTIFLHFAWDFAEPGIYGAINPGNSIHQSLFSGIVSGPSLLTGGQLGPQNSIQALILCTASGILFLWLAWKKNNFIKPFWNKN